MYIVITPEDETPPMFDHIIPEMIAGCRQQIAKTLFPNCRVIVALHKQYPDSSGYRVQIEFMSTRPDGKITLEQGANSFYLSPEGLLLDADRQGIDWKMISHECHLVTQKVRKVVEAKLLELMKRKG